MLLYMFMFVICLIFFLPNLCSKKHESSCINYSLLLKLKYRKLSVKYTNTHTQWWASSVKGPRLQSFGSQLLSGCVYMTSRGLGSADNILVLTTEMSVKEGWINPKRIGRVARRKVHKENVTSGDESDFCGRGFSEFKSEDEANINVFCCWKVEWMNWQRRCKHVGGQNGEQKVSKWVKSQG